MARFGPHQPPAKGWLVMYIYILLISIVMSGCYSQYNRNPQSPPFPIAHLPSALAVEERDEQVQSQYPNYPKVKPDLITPEVIIYEPGKLAWAKQDHRVVFHQSQENIRLSLLWNLLA